MVWDIQKPPFWPKFPWLVKKAITPHCREIADLACDLMSKREFQYTAEQIYRHPWGSTYAFFNVFSINDRSWTYARKSIQSFLVEPKTFRHASLQVSEIARAQSFGIDGIVVCEPCPHFLHQCFISM